MGRQSSIVDTVGSKQHRENGDDHYEVSGGIDWLQNSPRDQSQEGGVRCTSRFHFYSLTEIILNNYASIVEYLLPLVSVKSCGRTIVEILIKLGQPVHQSPKTVLHLTTYCCSLLFDTLKELGEYSPCWFSVSDRLLRCIDGHGGNVGESIDCRHIAAPPQWVSFLDTPEGLDLHKAFVDYMVMFVQSQTSYAVEFVMRTLLDRMMRQPPEFQCLFDLSATTSKATSMDENGTDKAVGDINVKKEPETELAAGDGKAVSRLNELGFGSSTAPLLVDNKKLSALKRNATAETGYYTPLDLVHSGVIRRKFPHGGSRGGGGGTNKGVVTVSEMEC